tara:strand:+ start:3303 stop:3593 length:291 start_codon:yes stop_codon:yes gene_type:complete
MLYEYYKKIIQSYENKNYEILLINSNIDKDKIKFNNKNEEAMNYMIYKWDIDHNDNRYKNLLKYVFIPNLDKSINFSNLKFDQFLNFCLKEKSIRS